jgi:hypothetical protein
MPDGPLQDIKQKDDKEAEQEEDIESQKTTNGIFLILLDSNYSHL